jgi:hypothetical protein
MQITNLGDSFPGKHALLKPGNHDEQARKHEQQSPVDFGVSYKYLTWKPFAAALTGFKSKSLIILLYSLLPTNRKMCAALRFF